MLDEIDLALLDKLDEDTPETRDETLEQWRGAGLSRIDHISPKMSRCSAPSARASSRAAMT